MDNPGRGRGRVGRPPLRGRRGGRGGRVGLGMARQWIQLTVYQGSDIVSAIEVFAQENQFPYVTVHLAYGIVSELRIEGSQMVHAGNYVIFLLRGNWSEHEFSGHRFFLNVHLIDSSRNIEIFGYSRFLRAGNDVRVYLEV